MKVYKSDGTVAVVAGMEVEGEDWSLTTKDMAEDRLTLTAILPYVDADGNSVTPDFDYSWYVEDDDIKYTLSTKEPNVSKNEKTLMASYTLVFGGADLYLTRFIFMEVQALGTEYRLAYNSNVAFVGTISDFIDRLQLNLNDKFGFMTSGDNIGEPVFKVVKGDDFPTGFSQSDYIAVSFSNITIWEAMTQSYELFGIRWNMKTVGGQTTITYAPQQDTISHVFEYRNGLKNLSVTNKYDEIYTRITGVGGTANIPLNHYILSDWNFIRDFEVPERTWYYRNLMPRVFRCYIMGHNDQRYSVSTTSEINPDENWLNVVDLNNRFTLADADNVTVADFRAWHDTYKNVWNKPADGSAQYFMLDLDDDCYSGNTVIDTDWDDMSKPPYGFKAYVRGWRDRENTPANTPSNFSPICYVESENKEKYGLREYVDDNNEQIYPTLDTDVNDIIYAEEVELEGVPVVIPAGAFPQSTDQVDFEASISNMNINYTAPSSGVFDFLYYDLYEDCKENFTPTVNTGFGRPRDGYAILGFSIDNYIYVHPNDSFNVFYHKFNIQKEGAWDIPDGKAKFELSMALNYSFTGFEIEANLIPVINGIEQNSIELVFTQRVMGSKMTGGVAYVQSNKFTPYAMNSETAYNDGQNFFKADVLLNKDADEYFLEIKIIPYNGIRYPKCYVKYKHGSDGAYEFEDYFLPTTTPSLNIRLNGKISLLESSEISKQTFDIWTKDIGFNIAEINNNKYALQTQIDTYEKLKSDVESGNVTPPTGFTTDGYIELIDAKLDEWESALAKLNAASDGSTIGSTNLYKYIGTEAAYVQFNTGLLAGEYNYEIASVLGEPQVFIDESKVNSQGDRSKYRITLIRNSDDYDATGLLLPGGARQAKEGDTFNLFNINLPFSYLYSGENRYEQYLRDKLATMDKHLPPVSFELDEIFMSEELSDEDRKKVKAGTRIIIKDESLLGAYDGGIYETTISSYTKEYKKEKFSTDGEN